MHICINGTPTLPFALCQDRCIGLSDADSSYVVQILLVKKCAAP